MRKVGATRVSVDARAAIAPSEVAMSPLRTASPTFGESRYDDGYDPSRKGVDVMKKLHVIGLLGGCLLAASLIALPADNDHRFEYRVLATKKTSTMEKELNAAGAEGFRFEGIMGGNTELGGSEAVAVVSRERGVEKRPSFEYKLMATSKTSTMQKEMQQAADHGFVYRGQTVFDTAFGGKEVVVIMERDRDAKPEHHEYKLLATSKTSTMQKELTAAGEAGFEFVGMTVAETAFGGKELVTILRRSPSK
jgi:hypothetical protein